VAWREDGRLLAVACDDSRIHVWDMTDRQPLSELAGHQSNVVRVEFQPGGDLLLSWGWDGESRLWDSSRGISLLSVTDYGVRFSRDGRRLAFTGGGRLRIWEVVGSSALRTLLYEAVGNDRVRVPRTGPWSADFSPDGRLLASAGYVGIRVWAPATGAEVGQLTAEDCRAVLFDDKGTSLLAHCREGLQRWPLDREPRASPEVFRVGKPQSLGVPGKGPFGRACLGPDGLLLATDGEKQAFLLHLDGPGKPIRWQEEREIGRVALSPDGRWAVTSSGASRGARVRDARTGNKVQELETGQAPYLAFSPNGRWLVTGSFTEYRFWDTASEAWQPVRTIPRPPNLGFGGPLAFSRDGRLLALADTTREVMLYDVEKSEELAVLAAPEPKILQALCFSPDGSRLAAVTENQVVQLWDLREVRRELAALRLDWDLPPFPAASSDPQPVTLKPEEPKEPKAIRSFTGHTEMVHSVAFFPDGRRVLTSSRDARLRVWDLETGEVLRTMTGHNASVWDATLSPDAHRILSGAADRTVRLWDADSGQQLQVLGEHKNSVNRVAFSPDGALALSAGRDSRVGLWDLTAGKETRFFEGHTWHVHAVAFSPDGRAALSGSADRTARLWEVATGKELRRFEGHTDSVLSVAFAPDGKRILTGGRDRSIRLWDLETGQEVRRFEGHANWVESVLFFPDGRFIVSGSADDTVRLWEVASGREVQQFNHGAPVRCVALSPDGRLILSGGDDHTARLWSVALPGVLPDGR
jgi:WD40 repeat protein